MRRRIAALVLLAAAAGGEDVAQVDTSYGFNGFEIYKFDDSLWGLRSHDIDGDGLSDLIVANNDKARIEVLLRRKNPVPRKRQTGERPVNTIDDDNFFERREILTEKQVWSIAVADLNQDGKLDVAYYGKPEELVVTYGDGKGGFPSKARFDIRDASIGNGLAAGDLNGDGRNDLALLGKNFTALLYQTDKGKLREPVKLPHAVKGITGLGLEDLDGDGRLDLVHAAPSSTRSIRVMFQQNDGSLGAEIALATEPWRSLDISDYDPAPGKEFLAIQRKSGLLRTLRLARKPSDAGLGEAEIHAFSETTSGKPRTVAVGDLNGDKRLDVVVTEPGVAQVAVYLQEPSGRLAGRKLFPSLANADAVRVADLDGDGRAEVLVLSVTEKAVGWSSWTKDGRLPFPTLLEGVESPKAFDVFDVEGDGAPEIAVVAGSKHELFMFKRGAAAPAVYETGLKSAPEDLMSIDIDQDGKRDVLMFSRYSPMRIMLGGDKGMVAGSKKRSGFVNKVGSGAAGVGDLDGDGKPELLVATKNFARALTLGATGLTIKDQVNGATARSDIKGVAALDVDGDKVMDVALFDQSTKAITLLKRNENGVFAVVASVALGTIDFRGMRTADVNGDGKDDLIVLGKRRFAVLYAGGTRYELEAIHTGESTARDAELNSVAVGDLNNDGRLDVAAVDTANHAIQIFSYGHKAGFAETIRWRVFEKKLHDARRNRSGIRQVVIADLTGDGKNDMALLVHDRLIVYTQ